MARIEIDGIYKHAPLTDAQISGIKRNLDREIIIKRTAVTSGLIPTDGASNPTTSQAAYPTSYIFAMDYDSTDDGGDNPNIRRNIPTLELLGSTGDDTAGANWINIQTNPNTTYNYVAGGSTLQEVVEALDGQVSTASLKYISDANSTGSISTSSDAGVLSNTNTGADFQVTFGSGNNITSSSFSSILGGGGCTINNASTYSAIISAGGSTITNGSSNSFIGSAPSSTITNSSGTSFIGSAPITTIDGSVSSFIGSAPSASITSSAYSFIGSAPNATITTSENSTALSSSSAVITNSQNAFVATAISPQITSSAFGIILSGSSQSIITDSHHSIIGMGISSYIDTSPYSFMGTASSSYIQNSASGHNSMLNASNSKMDYATNSAIIGGQFNYIYGTGANQINFAFIGSGAQNKIDTTVSTGGTIGASIINGTSNYINNIANYSIIGDGAYNYITNATHSSLMGGYINYISDNGNGYDYDIADTRPSAYTALVGGYNNAITTTAYICDGSFIGAGYQNHVTNVRYSAIVAGKGNFVSAYTNPQYHNSNIIGAGDSNSISGTYNCGIFSGASNYIYDASSHAFIGAGLSNTISDSDYSFIGGGQSNTVSNIVTHAFIGGGQSNYITEGGIHSSIVGGFTNQITAGSQYSFIGGGENNYIYGSGSAYNGVIVGGKLNTITGGADYAFIGGGESNLLTDGGDYTVIGGGYSNSINSGVSYGVIAGGNNNEITDGSTASFIGGGQNNTIMDAGSYSGILGGSGNTLAEGCTDSFIIGSGIDTTGVHRTETTFMNNVTLWDRGFELTSRTPNVGDVPIVESVSGDVAILTWGAPITTADPNPTSSFSHYYISINGLTVIPDDYISIESAESAAPFGFNKQFTVGMEATNTGYNQTDPTLTSLAHIYTTTVPNTPAGIIESQGIKLEDGYEYTLWVNSGALAWTGPYLQQPSTTPAGEYPEPEFDYDPQIKIVRNGSTRTVKMGSDTISTNITANRFFSTVNGISYATNDSIDTTSTGTTGSIELFLMYNYATDEVNLGFRNTFMHHSYVKKVAATYDTDASGNVTVNWPVSEYALPTYSDGVCFWDNDPATNSGIPHISVTNISSNDVTIAQLRGSNVTGVPCWVYVHDRTPRLAGSFAIGVAKRAL